jgi:hypothetical protein
MDILYCPISSIWSEQRAYTILKYILKDQTFFSIRVDIGSNPVWGTFSSYHNGNEPEFNSRNLLYIRSNRSELSKTLTTLRFQANTLSLFENLSDLRK